MNEPIVASTDTPSKLVWRCTKVEHLDIGGRSKENGIFLWLYVGDVVLYSGVVVEFGLDWKPSGGRFHLDGDSPNPSTVIFPFAPEKDHYIQILDPQGYPSDRVSNLNFESDSYLVRFDLLPGTIKTQAAPLDDKDKIIADLKADNTTMRALLTQIATLAVLKD